MLLFETSYIILSYVALRPSHFTAEERVPGTHCIGGLLSPRARLGSVRKRKFLAIPGLEPEPLGCPACSHSKSYIFFQMPITMPCRAV